MKKRSSPLESKLQDRKNRRESSLRACHSHLHPLVRNPSLLAVPSPSPQGRKGDGEEDTGEREGDKGKEVEAVAGREVVHHEEKEMEAESGRSFTPDPNQQRTMEPGSCMRLREGPGTTLTLREARPFVQVSGLRKTRPLFKAASTNCFKANLWRGRIWSSWLHSSVQNGRGDASRSRSTRLVPRRG